MATVFNLVIIPVNEIAVLFTFLNMLSIGLICITSPPNIAAFPAVPPIICPAICNPKPAIIGSILPPGFTFPPFAYPGIIPPEFLGTNSSGPFSPTRYGLPPFTGPPIARAPSTTVSNCNFPPEKPTTLNFPPKIDSFSDLELFVSF